MVSWNQIGSWPGWTSAGPLERPQAVGADGDGGRQGPHGAQERRRVETEGLADGGVVGVTFGQELLLPGALAGDHEQGAERHHDEEPVGQGDRGGHAAGHGPQDEPGADAGQVEDRLVLRGRRSRPAAPPRRRPSPHPGATRRAGRRAPPTRPAARSRRRWPAATGTTPAATGRWRLVGCRRSAAGVDGVVEVVGAGGGQAEDAEGAGRVPQHGAVEQDAGGGRGHEDQQVLDPLAGPRQPDQPADATTPTACPG